MVMDHRPTTAVRRDSGSHNGNDDDDLAVEYMGGSTSKAEKANLAVEDEKRRIFEEELDQISWEAKPVRVTLNALSVDIVLNETNDHIELIDRETAKVIYRFDSMLAFRSFLGKFTSSDICQRVPSDVNVNSENFFFGGDCESVQFGGGGGGVGSSGVGVGVGGVGDSGGGGGVGSGGGTGVGGRDDDDDDDDDDVSGGSTDIIKPGEKKKVVNAEEDEAPGSVQDHSVRDADQALSLVASKPTKDKTKSSKRIPKPKDTTPVLHEISFQTRETRGVAMLIHSWKIEVRKAQDRIQANCASLSRTMLLWNPSSER